MNKCKLLDTCQNQRTNALFGVKYDMNQVEKHD